MDLEIKKHLMSLREAIESDERLKRLLLLEEKVEKDDSLKPLVKAKDEAQEEYERAIHLGNEEKLKAEKKLYLAKKELDEHPLVKEYNEAFINVKDLYMWIDDILFSPFRKKSFVLLEGKDD